MKIKGEVRSFQTDLATGAIIPGSDRGWRSNTVIFDLKNYLAYLIGANATNWTLDNLFTENGTVASVGVAQDGKDGIAHYSSVASELTHILLTTKNAGGTEAEAYVEFYGYIDGAVTLDEYLRIGFAYINSTLEFTRVFASVAVNETIASGRRYHHYWKFTLS